MAKKTNSQTIKELRTKAKKLTNKAESIENKMFCQLGRIAQKYLENDVIETEKLSAFNAELKQFLKKQ